MNILVLSIIFGMFSGAIFKVIDILREHKKRLSSIEDFLYRDEEWLENEVDD